MANYNQIGYGSKGSDVTELQKLLNQNGYTLDTDGIFGSNTLAAVKDYQQKNNLSVDGVVGSNTWGALKNASTATPDTPADTPTDAPKYEAYKPSDTVTQAELLLQQHLAQKPGDYQSPWADQLTDIINRINNREDFSYDLNGDALYQQYKDQFTTQGKLAMMDTMGQAAALTGGYGNSYAQSVGQQTYQRYLQGLNDKVPELYQLALSKYNAEGDEMYDQAALLGQMEDQEYGRYRDSVSDFYTELGRLTDAYITERDYDYSKWADGRNFDYQIDRDAVADQQWQAQFDEAKRQFDKQYALSASKSSGGGGGGYVDNGNLSTSDIKKLQTALGVTADGKWGPSSQAAAQEKLGASSAEAAWENYQKNLNGRIEGNDGRGNNKLSTDTENTKLFRNSVMTGDEFARHGNKATVNGKTYTSYKRYIEACLADWTDNDVPYIGKNLTDEEVEFLMDAYGL